MASNQLPFGFAIFRMLIIMDRYQADLDDLSGGSSVAMVGGISAILLGTVFLLAACLH
jgi:hypothetical protein